MFGRVVPSHLAVIDAIAGILTFAFDAPFANLPLINYSGSGPIPPENTVLVRSARELPLYPSGSGDSVLSFSVSSDKPSLVSPSIQGSQIRLEYAARGSGVAKVTVRATDRSGAFVDDTFQVTIPADQKTSRTATP